LAGVVGTVCLDVVGYLRYRRAGGEKRPLEWEFGPVEGWENAPDPGKVAKRVIEGFTGVNFLAAGLGPSAPPCTGGYGSAAALYGIVAGSVREPSPLYGLPFGAAVWAAGYVVLPEAGIYKPIWEYDAKTLVRDLAGHLQRLLRAGQRAAPDAARPGDRDAHGAGPRRGRRRGHPGQRVLRRRRVRREGGADTAGPVGDPAR